MYELRKKIFILLFKYFSRYHTRRNGRANNIAKVKLATKKNETYTQAIISATIIYIYIYTIRNNASNNYYCHRHRHYPYGVARRRP